MLTFVIESFFYIEQTTCSTSIIADLTAQLFPGHLFPVSSWLNNHSSCMCDHFAHATKIKFLYCVLFDYYFFCLPVLARMNECTYSHVHSFIRSLIHPSIHSSPYRYNPYSIITKYGRIRRTYIPKNAHQQELAKRYAGLPASRLP